MIHFGIGIYYCEKCNVEHASFGGLELDIFDLET